MLIKDPRVFKYLQSWIESLFSLLSSFLQLENSQEKDFTTEQFFFLHKKSPEQQYEGKIE